MSEKSAYVNLLFPSPSLNREGWGGSLYLTIVFIPFLITMPRALSLMRCPAML